VWLEGLVSPYATPSALIANTNEGEFAKVLSVANDPPGDIIDTEATLLVPAAIQGPWVCTGRYILGESTDEVHKWEINSDGSITDTLVTFTPTQTNPDAIQCIASNGRYLAVASVDTPVTNHFIDVWDLDDDSHLGQWEFVGAETGAGFVNGMCVTQGEVIIVHDTGTAGAGIGAEITSIDIVTQVLGTRGNISLSGAFGQPHLVTCDAERIYVGNGNTANDIEAFDHGLNQLWINTTAGTGTDNLKLIADGTGTLWALTEIAATSVHIAKVHGEDGTFASEYTLTMTDSGPNFFAFDGTYFYVANSTGTQLEVIHYEGGRATDMVPVADVNHPTNDMRELVTDGMFVYGFDLVTNVITRAAGGKLWGDFHRWNTVGGRGGRLGLRASPTELR
jgi:hypothetical protein